MLNLAPENFQNQMKWIFIGLVDDALFILMNSSTTPDEAYATYRALTHIYNQGK